MSVASGNTSDDEGVLIDSLSPRERQLLEMATNGSTDQAIANGLGISLATVSTYWGRIRIKYGPLGRTEIVARYLRALMNRANAELQANESRMRTVLDTNPVGIFLTDPDGLPVYMNPAYEAIAGKDEAALVLEGSSALVFPADRPEGGDSHESRAEGSGYVSEHRWERSDGSAVWVRLRSEEWRHGDRLGGRVGVVEDITKEHEAQERRKESEERYELLFAFAPIAIVSVDQNLDVIGMNASALRMFGYALDEIVGQPLQALIPDVLQGGSQEYIEAFGGGSPKGPLPPTDRPEARGVRRDGSDFPCEASVVRQSVGGKPHYTAIVREVAERTMASGQGEPLDAIPLIAWRLDASGEIIEANEALLEATGRAMGRLGGKAHSGLVHPDDLAVYAECLRYAAEGGSKIDLRLRLRCTPDETDRWHVARIRLLPKGESIVVCTDVHELEVAADELRRVKAVLGAVSASG